MSVEEKDHLASLSKRLESQKQDPDKEWFRGLHGQLEENLKQAAQRKSKIKQYLLNLKQFWNDYNRQILPILAPFLFLLRLVKRYWWIVLAVTAILVFAFLPQFIASENRLLDLLELPKWKHSEWRTYFLSVGGLIAIAFAFYRSIATERQINQTEDAKNTDRFQKAAEMLGSSRLSVRQAGIFALEELVKRDADNYFTPVQELLASFLKDRTVEQRKEAKDELEKGTLQNSECEATENELDGQEVEKSEIELPDTAADCQTAITAISNLIKKFSSKYLRLDLRGVNLKRAELYFANLKDVRLDGADLRLANLYEANLGQAILREANLGRANLQDANLERAYLVQSNLRGAELYWANLFRANLQGANLYEANLYRANLRGIKGFLITNDLGKKTLDSRLAARFKQTYNLDEATFEDGILVTGSNPIFDGNGKYVSGGWTLTYEEPKNKN